MSEQGMSELEKVVAGAASLSLTDSAAEFDGVDNAMPLLRVKNKHCSTLVALQGAQVLSHIVDGQDLFWLSPNKRFEPGFPIRGGMPVCMPWFGVNQDNPDLPNHGFLRNREWRLEAAEESEDSTMLLFVMDEFKEYAHELWPYPFSAQLRYEFGAELSAYVYIQNHSVADMPMSYAMHSYHPVADIAEVSLAGLDGLEYLDNADGLQRNVQHGAVRFDGELDRVYLKAGEPQSYSLHGGVLKVAADNSPTCIVWNPGAELAAKMPDIGAGEHTGFVCIERGRAFDEAMALPPGSAHASTISLSISKV